MCAFPRPEPGSDMAGSALPIGPLGLAFAEECCRNLEATVQVINYLCRAFDPVTSSFARKHYTSPSFFCINVTWPYMRF